MPYSLSDPLLRECAASGQLDASQIHQHVQAGELQASNAFIAAQCDRAGEVYPRDGSDFTVTQSTAHRLMKRMADIGATVLLETTALRVMSNYRTQLYDSTQVDETELPEGKELAVMQRDLADAVAWLDSQGLLVRPVAGAPQCVVVGAAS